MLERGRLPGAAWCGVARGRVGVDDGDFVWLGADDGDLAWLGEDGEKICVGGKMLGAAALPEPEFLRGVDVPPSIRRGRLRRSSLSSLSHRASRSESRRPNGLAYCGGGRD
jgi:hypothetical protein